jgi:hypothetical protein
MGFIYTFARLSCINANNLWHLANLNDAFYQSKSSKKFSDGSIICMTASLKNPQWAGISTFLNASERQPSLNEASSGKVVLRVASGQNVESQPSTFGTIGFFWDTLLLVGHMGPMSALCSALV